jgi:hypothetical protein
MENGEFVSVHHDAVATQPAAPQPGVFMSDKTRAFVVPVRKMLAEGINVQATGEATNRVVEGAFRSLVEHIDELEMDLAALRTAVALSSPAPAAEEAFRRGAEEMKADCVRWHEEKAAELATKNPVTKGEVTRMRWHYQSADALRTKPLPKDKDKDKDKEG